jgi:hypothetical protein
MRLEQQRSLLESFAPFAVDFPYRDGVSTDGLRYRLPNEYYSQDDGAVLYFMLRHLRPARFVEVGSGFTSALALDTNERHLDGAMQMTLIEPYADRLESLVHPGDLERTTLVRSKVQDVPVGLFDQLDGDDVLLVDSSHVAKTGSDVNHLLFTVLPRLRPGVHVHFHDVPAGFEYPPSWVLEGRSWNEAYALRAFLQFNRDFEIVLYTNLVARLFADELRRWCPGIAFGPGTSVWLRRL